MLSKGNHRVIRLFIYSLHVLHDEGKVSEVSVIQLLDETSSDVPDVELIH